MRNFLNKPYNWLLLPSLITLLIWPLQPEGFDIHMHDTYFVISPIYLYLPVIIFFIVNWLLYRITDKHLRSRTLSWVSVALMLLTYVLIVGFFVWFVRGAAGQQAYVDVSTYQRTVWISVLLVTAPAVVPAIAQVIYLINLVWGVMANRPPKIED
ncbi:hypothetical protein MKQ68_05785 [Chitinophaga horti]|uniref:Uncharacterized protein n=1 Tax=Chitinophaga horti TaxID=2920382 RepID=A0ABY6J8J3_9BACT|nr:hypothetical protein [Chitinophaga horti]UYQ94601.1 hypothetical protein MKQ68_05785 [Chitinophaga horti]